MNLGVGIPTMVSNYLKGRDVILHAENGVLGYGRMVTENEINEDIFNAAGQYVALNPGASFFDSVTSFEMARGGHIDTVILGAYQVDQAGNVANWSTRTRSAAASAARWTSSRARRPHHRHGAHRQQGSPQAAQEVHLSTHWRGLRSYVVTDLAMLRWDKERFVVDAVAPGFTPQEVIALTEMEIGSRRTSAQWNSARGGA